MLLGVVVIHPSLSRAIGRFVDALAQLAPLGRDLLIARMESSIREDAERASRTGPEDPYGEEYARILGDLADHNL